MIEWTYTIYDDYFNAGDAVATGMTIDVALLLLRALCEKYGCETRLRFIIEREVAEVD